MVALQRYMVGTGTVCDLCLICRSAVFWAAEPLCNRAGVRARCRQRRRCFVILQHLRSVPWCMCTHSGVNCQASCFSTAGTRVGGMLATAHASRCFQATPR